MRMYQGTYRDNSLRYVVKSTLCKPLFAMRKSRQDPRYSLLNSIFMARQSLAESVGSVLSDANVYLQEPTYLPEIITYCNPHVYSVDRDFSTPRFREKRCETKRNFEHEIDAIIHEIASTDPQESFWQDPRIRSPLCK